MATDGFVRLPNWLIDDSDLTLHELAVYVVLLRFRNPKTGKCWPGMSAIADRARVSRKTVVRVIPKLEKRGMIRVERRSTVTVNQSNTYWVALPTEQPKGLVVTSKRGRRIPKRSAPRDSESVGRAVTSEPRDSESVPRDSQSLPRDSQSLPPGTPSPSKKNQGRRSIKKTHEQAVTPAFSEGTSAKDLYTFDEEDDHATEKQVAYLRDLAIHVGYQTGGGIPNDLQLQRWRKLTRDEATQQIRGYLKALGRPDDIYYPQAGDPEFAALSRAGKEFAETAGMPDSVMFNEEDVA